MVTERELEREKHEARLKYQRDELSRLHEAFQEGYHEGFQEGYQCGLLIGQAEVLEEFLKVKPTPIEILEAMTLGQLQQLVEQLKAQMAEHG